MGYAAPMFVTSLEVSGLKRLRKVMLDLRRGDQPRAWTVILGENGRCKTTLLRAIAMAASGAARTNQLADVPSLVDRRDQAQPARLTIGARFSLRGDADLQDADIASEISVEAGHALATGSSFWLDSDFPSEARPKPGLFIDPIADARQRNARGWVVLGYGTSRSLPRPFQSTPMSDPAWARLANLFDRAPIVGTGFADQLEDPNEFARVLREALVEGDLVPDLTGVELQGRGGVRTAQDLDEGHRFALKLGDATLKLPSTWLSHGQQATIAWIADLIGHFFLDAGRPVERADMRGLVLIDEIDLHLHPKWQVRIVDGLRRAFPNLQFVATTHSPMVLPSLRADELVVLDEDEDGSVVARPPDASPQLMTAAELYASFFDLRASASPLARDYRRYGFLVGNAARTDAEDGEIAALRQQLQAAGADPGWEPVPREPRA